MGNVEQLNDELAIATLVEEYEAMRPTIEGGGASKEDLDKYHDLNGQIAKLRTAYKEKYAPPAPAEEDAAATPAPIAVSTTAADGTEG